MNKFAHQFNINKSRDSWISSRYCQRNNMERNPESGLALKSTARHDRQLVKIVKINPRKMAVDVTRSRSHL